MRGKAGGSEAFSEGRVLQKPWPAQPLRQDTEERRGQLPSLQGEELGLQAGGGQGFHTEEIRPV